jgi:uncharacterized DUF497 family protein
MALTFEWDEEKATANMRKHGVSFDEAKTVFNDPLAMTISDPEHSSQEDRYIDLGMSARERILLVWYTERGASIRIIGSRKATRSQRQQYEEEH